MKIGLLLVGIFVLGFLTGVAISYAISSMLCYKCASSKENADGHWLEIRGYSSKNHRCKCSCSDKDSVCKCNTD